jgi:hypothetical protein
MDARTECAITEGQAVNGATHESYAKATARLVLAHGFAPAAVPLLSEKATRDQFLSASSMPDSVQEVSVRVPGDGEQTDLFEQNLSSLGHFQLEGDRGYLLTADSSLYVPGAAAAALGMGRCRVSSSEDGIRPPLAGLLDERPIALACRAQDGETLGVFRFPSAAQGAEYFARGARYWLSEGNLAGARGCLGYACHFVHDVLVPHHAWGSILDGHQDWENAQEREWLRTIVKVQVDNNLFADTVGKSVRRELGAMTSVTVGDLCREGAAWARHKFGEPRHLDECTGDVALDVSIRAIAASVRALELVA